MNGDTPHEEKKPDAGSPIMIGLLVLVVASLAWIWLNPWGQHRVGAQLPRFHTDLAPSPNDLLVYAPETEAARQEIAKLEQEAEARRREAHKAD